MRIPYDVPKIHMYTRIRRSPYFHAAERHGVQSYSVCNRMYHPRHYDDPIAEYWKLVRDVTLWDVGVERQVEISGPDALQLADLITPRDLTKCAVGQCKWLLNTDVDGGVINNPVLLRIADDCFWFSVADGDLLLWVKGVASQLKLDVRIGEPDVAPVQIQGPKSQGLMVDLFGQRVLDLKYYWMSEFQLDGMDVVVGRTGYTGEIGYEVYLRHASRDAVRLWDAILEAGRPHDLAVIGPCQIRRVEAGIYSYGSEIALDNNMYSDYHFLNPYELGLEWTVNLEAPADFIGKAALTRIAEQGVDRKIVGVEIGGDPIIGYLDDYLPVTEGDRQVGQVSSAFWSPRLEKNIGFALVPIALAGEGTRLRVHTAARGEVDAVVVPKPFIDPTKGTPKGAAVATAATAK